MMATVSALARLHMRPGPLRETGVLASKAGEPAVREVGGNCFRPDGKAEDRKGGGGSAAISRSAWISPRSSNQPTAEDTGVGVLTAV